MKQAPVKRLGLFLFSCLFSLSCISFRPPEYADPELLLTRITVCDQAPESVFPENSPSVFRRDKALYAVIQIGPMENRTTLQWKWFDPRGRAARSSPLLEVNRDNRNLAHVIAWDRLPAEALQEGRGRWTVALFSGDLFLGRAGFDIE